MSRKTNSNRGRKDVQHATNVHASGSGRLTSVEALLEELERADSTETLTRQRSKFIRQLRTAHQKDHSASSRRIQAREQTKTALGLRQFTADAERDNSHLQSTVQRAVNYAGIYFGPPGHIGVVPQLEPIEKLDGAIAWLVAELHKRERSCKQIASWYRRKVPQKRDQWGPATVTVVDAAVRFAQEAFSDQSKKDKPTQQAQYYAGLLCMHAGLLTAAHTTEPQKLSDVVRRRLDRAVLWIQTGEHAVRSAVTSVIPFPRPTGPATTRRNSRSQ